MSKHDEPLEIDQPSEEEPRNPILEMLARMSEGKRQPFKPMKLPEIEAQDPVQLGRHGDCGIALEVLFELYPSGIPHRLTKDGTDFAHTFLLHHGRPLDMGGYTDIEAMRSLYNDPSLKLEPVDMAAVRRYFRGWRDVDEKNRLVEHFKGFILRKVGDLFPELEAPPDR